MHPRSHEGVCTGRKILRVVPPAGAGVTYLVTWAGHILQRCQMALLDCIWAALGDGTRDSQQFATYKFATDIPFFGGGPQCSAVLQQSIGEQASQHTHKLRQTQSVLLRLALTTAEEKLSKVIGPL